MLQKKPSNKQNKIKTVLSGVRATNLMHIGNYYGAVQGMLELQNDPEYQTYYMVADVHTITTPFNPEELAKLKIEVVKDYLACGLDPKKSTIFLQSMVIEHMAFSSLLSSLVTVARLQHLPTFKEKVKQHPENVTMALLNYPVLMASDILLYKSNAVPVGKDQESHLEVAREIARKLNSQYNLDFPEPTTFKTTGYSVPSLLGEGKMSKSVDGSYIALSDSLEVVKQKLAKVPTDSGKGAKAPSTGGVASLLKLVELFEGSQKAKEYKESYKNTGLRYKELKDQLAHAIYQKLEPIQIRRENIQKDSGYVQDVINEGVKKASLKASETYLQVKKAMGL